MRKCLLALWFILVCLGIAALGTASAQAPEVHVLRVDGTIVPIVADYIDRGIDKAEEDGAAALIIRINTPGGMLSTTEDIVDRILEARVPVVVYVDRWAGSAGTFITMAAHVAAMAPASRIGAASPVSVGEDLSETMKKKINEDTAAHIRGLADLRGRNQKAAEATVREALSFTDKEALGIAPISADQQKVLGMETAYLDPPLVDLGAKNVDELIQKIDGMEVKVGDETITIHTAGYLIHENGMNLVERFLHAISDPNIAYILLSIGSLGIIIEFYNPGLVFPGVAGAISLLLAFYSLSVLDAHWSGIILILLAFGFFIAEVFVSGFGLLTAGGIASLIIGSMILFSGDQSMEGLGIDWWVIAIVVAIIVGFFVFAIQAIVRTQKRKQPTGADGMIGMRAVVKTPLTPKGTVLVHGELWEATLDEGQADPGEEVIVTEVKGLKLGVTKKNEEGSK
ncbi:MAG: nodulation protein NfeD [Chloroflexi bacterium]|nr:nodulation protein NfeD [Chloroflexota bacterium]